MTEQERDARKSSAGARANIAPSAISSPCVGVCVACDGHCIGCLRSLSEIAAWRLLSEAERLRIMREELPRRRKSAG
ncbi:MAG: DUF1289 domain-containing protein [Terriglobales bacterium]